MPISRWAGSSCARNLVSAAIAAFALSALWIYPAFGVDYDFTKASVSAFPSDSLQSRGVGWADYDGDGDLDVFICQRYSGDTNRLYRNDGSGTFSRVTTGDIATDASWSTACSWGDYDNDGFPDLVVANDEGFDNFLYRNLGDGTFEKIVTGPVVTDGGRSVACSWGDLNLDGYLDLLIANANEFGNQDFLYLNDRNGGFVRIVDDEVVNAGSSHDDVKLWDFDQDGDLDVTYVDTVGGIESYTNRGDATFEAIGGAGLPARAMAVGDMDNDGDLDWFVAMAGTNNLLIRNIGNGSFSIVNGDPVGNEGGGSYGGAWADYDNDGDLDLLVWNAILDDTENWLYQNDGTGSFTKVTSGLLVNDPGVVQSSSAAWADMDRDGALDLALGNGNWDSLRDYVYVNTGGGNAWLVVQLEGVASNRSGIGARIATSATIAGSPTRQVRVIQGLSGGLGQSALEAHFGLGDATIADSVVVTWPSGIETRLESVATNQIITITEPDSLIARLSGRPRDVHVPGNVQFEDLSSGTPTSWAWDLDGDMVTDRTESDPVELYAVPGTYSVSLTVSDGVTQDVAEAPDYVVAWGDTTVTDLTLPTLVHQASSNWQGFPPRNVSDDKLRLTYGWRSGDTQSGNDFPHWISVDLDSAFTIHDLGVLAHFDQEGSRLRDFTLEASNDGTTYVPLHGGVFTNQNEYRWQTFDVADSLRWRYVRLTGIDNWIASGVSSSQMIIEEWEIGTQLTARIGVSTTSGPAPLSVDFLDQSDGSPTHWQWDFDGNGSVDATASDPTFVYTEPGLYTVGLRVNDASYVSKYEKPDFIHVSATSDFAVSDTMGTAPLTVQFADLTNGSPIGWAWDFDNDGFVDSTDPNPQHTYTTPDLYSVKLIVTLPHEVVAVTRTDLVRVLNTNTMILNPITITTTMPTPLPVSFIGADSLGAISMFVSYDSTKIHFEGIQTLVPGETFASGLVDGKISIQWFDETGGSDPIIPGVDPDTLFTILFTNKVAQDLVIVQFDEGLSTLGDPLGDPIAVDWLDEYPFGHVYINVGVIVSGRVGYYWLDASVANVLCSMGPPNPDVSTDAGGVYVFDPYPHGTYTLNVSKTDDLSGINALDAIKVVRHGTGVEPLDNPYKERAANVNGDAQINALDAIKIVRAAVALEALASGDWVFEPDAVTFSPLNADQPNTDFIAIRMGDVNGDWLPDQPRIAPVPGAREGLLTVSLPDTTVLVSATPVAIPMVVSSFDGVGALSFRVAYSDSVLSYAGVTSFVDGVTFTANGVGEEVRIEWFDPTGGASPISIGSDTLLTIGFDLVGDVFDVSPLDFTDASVVADAVGDPIAGVSFVDGSCAIGDVTTATPALPGVPTVLRLLPVWPSPTRTRTQVAFELPEPGGRVSMRVFDVAGRIVRVLSDETYPPGRHRLSWELADPAGRPASPGVYFIRLEALHASDTHKVVVVR